MGSTSAGRAAAATIALIAIGLLTWVFVKPADNETAASAPSAASAADDRVPNGIDMSQDNNVRDDTITNNEAADSDATPEPTPEPLELENFGARMSLDNLDGWLNTDITSLDDLNGQVVLVEMWTFACRNCKARIPYNQQWYEQYKDQGFEIVGVHAPEFSFEAEIPNIEQALIDLGVTWPVALDTNKRNFHDWQEGRTGYWPRSYLIDQNGDIRFDHVGEGKYSDLEAAIEHLLDNPPAPTS